jgi:hypothetical protein
VTGLLVVSIIGRDSHRWASELRVNKGWVCHGKSMVSDQLRNISKADADAEADAEMVELR